MSGLIQPLRVLLIAGGWSPERQISLRGAEQIAKALIARGHQVVFFDLRDGFSAMLELCQGMDVAFINLHGAPGEDGLIQALLERVGLPHQGSGPAGSFLALHKTAAKTLFRMAGLRTPDWIFLPEAPPANWQPDLAWPLFVKSNTGGSSLDLFRAGTRAELDAALRELFQLGHEVLIEEMIVGQEVTCGVLDLDRETRALEPVLILPKRAFFDYHDKYSEDGAEEICPAPLAAEIKSQIAAAALTAHKTLGLRGYSRTDFILNPAGEFFVLETNTLPGLTPASLLPKEAKAAGLEFADLLEALLDSAMRK